jgi:serine/threonine-protein kinase
MVPPSEARSPVEVLADEFLTRCKRGETPTIREYCDRHPDLADEIRDVFEAVLMVEDLKPGSSDVSGSVGGSVNVNGKRLRQVGDYRILGEIGRGGMGVVYEAEQQALGRRVALKVLPKTVAGDGSAQIRFQREARAAARMHHTNIVPVFDVGQDGDHLYYAMQLIHGQGLDLVIQDLKRLRAQSTAEMATNGKAGDRSIAASLVAGQFEKEDLAGPGSNEDGATAAFEGSAPSSAMLPGQSELSTATSNRASYYRSVAQIGVQTAAALGYAHGRGIVHRDIKPGNLILDTTGNVWVTDFGLAKTGDGGMTHTGDILGTIRYMSPERFRGQCDVRADVYALGMTLYELLTLKAAYASGDRLKLIEMIRQEEAPGPRSIDPRIPRDLETIVMKAIDKDPRRRYQSADEMGEDLQRFVNDEPIRARRVGPVERFTRWSRRNPTVAGLTAAVLVLMAAGTAVSTRQAVVATRAREDLAAKHHELLAEQAKVEARNQELAAEQAKVQARFDMAVKAIETFHTGVSEDALLKNAEFKELRTKLLTEAAQFYGDLEKLLAGQSDPKSRKALAAGYFQLGELTGKIGDAKEAVAVHRKALAIRRELAAAPGADVETWLDVARSLERMGRQIYYSGDSVGALRAFEEQRDIAERLEATDPTDAVRYARARALSKIGYALDEMGKPTEALETYRKAQAVLQKLADAHPTNTDYPWELAQVHNNAANTLSDMGKRAESWEDDRKALAIRQKLVDAHPTNTDFQFRLGRSHCSMSVGLLDTGRFQEALAAGREALEIIQKLVHDQPAVTDYQDMLAYVHNRIGVTHGKMGKPTESLEAYRQALLIQQRLVDTSPGNPHYQSSLSVYHTNVGLALGRLRRFAEAFAAFEAGLAIHRKLVEAEPDNKDLIEFLAAIYASCGAIRVRAGQPAEAAGDLRKALELWPDPARLQPQLQFARLKTQALLAGLAGDAKSGVSKDEAKVFADQSIAALAVLLKTGWALPSELREPDFDAVRGRADFQKLVAEVEAKAEKVPEAVPPPHEKK